MMDTAGSATNPELTRRMAWWEFRHTLRSATCWWLALIVAGSSYLGLRDSTGSAAVNGALLGQLHVLTLILALWTVWSVKRLVGRDVSDDWLLVLSWRQAVVSRFLAAGGVAALLAAVSVVSGWLVMAWCGAERGPSAQWWAGHGYLALALLQPLAVAALIVAAADFLVLETPAVLFGTAFVTVVWQWLPHVGFASVLATDESAVLRHALLPALLCVVSLAVAARRSEDFWRYCRLAHEQRETASLARVRAAIELEHGSPRRARLEAGFRRRQAWRRLGLGTDWARELARHPVLGRRPRLVRRQKLAIIALVAGVVVAVGVLHRVDPHSFSWHDLATGLREAGPMLVAFFAGLWAMVRLTATSAQAVVEEREQQTLGLLVLAPRGARRLVRRKTVAVLAQAAPLLLLAIVIGCLDHETRDACVEVLIGGRSRSAAHAYLSSCGILALLALGLTTYGVGLSSVFRSRLVPVVMALLVGGYLTGCLLGNLRFDWYLRYGWCADLLVVAALTLSWSWLWSRLAAGAAARE